MNIKPLNRDPLLLNKKTDQLFENGPFPKPFSFNEHVAEVFDDMANRSIPFYEEINHSIVEWAYLNQQKNTTIYDIGCSTGTTILAIANKIKTSTHFIGIDSSSPMIAKAEKKLQNFPQQHSLTLSTSNALQIPYSQASMVIMNYTLQFIPVGKRIELIKKIFTGLLPGGVLFLSEKTCSTSPFIQEITTFCYENFKKRNGYSQNEIERKKESLDQVLIPMTLDQHSKMLLECGFRHCEPLIKWNNFVSMVAIK